MDGKSDETGQHFTVLVNHEEQFSLWPSHKAVPGGWRPAGKEGTREECLEYVDAVWTDMRPLSLRRKMQPDP